MGYIPTLSAFIWLHYLPLYTKKANKIGNTRSGTRTNITKNNYDRIKKGENV